MIIGPLFVVVWLGLAIGWFFLSLMAASMAYDGRAVTTRLHEALMILMFLGEAVVVLAGLIGGAAFVFADHAPLLWRIFWITLAVGALLQVGGITRLAKGM